MGVWGTSLYSGDFAMDLRASIGAVCRLPFAPDRLIDILSETEPAAANNPLDDDHTAFWLIVADQFAKRGIVSNRVRDKALAILDNGEDIAMLERRGMTPPDVGKRRKVLSEVRARIVGATVEKPRTVLAKPQALLMDIGDVVLFPTCRGRCINPYYSSKEQDTQYTKSGPVPWAQDGWGAAIIIDCGRAFEFLSWYRPLVIVETMTETPALEDLTADIAWRLELPGTCSASHFKKMELQKFARLPVDRDKVGAVFPGLRPGISSAVSDISIANRLHAIPKGQSTSTPTPGQRAKGRASVVVGVKQLLSDKKP